MAEGKLSLVLTMLVVMLAVGATGGAASKLVSLRNVMLGPITVHCHSPLDGDLGQRSVSVGDTYDFTVPGNFLSGKRYECTFQATGKPTTTFWVFIGWGGVENSPCGCRGDVCLWIINDGGFSCNNNAYFHPWG